MTLKQGSPVFDVKDMIWQPFYFQNKAKITSSPSILSKSDRASCNVFSCNFKYINDFRTISYISAMFSQP